MTFCLLVYNADITLLSDNIFIDSTHLKILFDRNIVSSNNITITGSANVLLLWPQDNDCLGTTKGPYSGLALDLGM